MGKYIPIPVKQGKKKMAKDKGWKKGIEVNVDVGRGSINLVLWLIVGTAVAAAAYLIWIPGAWSNLKLWWCRNIEKRTNCDEVGSICPKGFHSVDRCKGTGGLPGMLCGIGQWVAGGYGSCEPDSTGPGPEPGRCDLGLQQVCEISGGTWEITEAGCICRPKSGITKDSHGCLIGAQHWCESDKKCLDNAQQCTPNDYSCNPCYEWSPTFGKCLYSPGMCADTEKPCPTGETRLMPGYPCKPKGSTITDAQIFDYGGCECGSKVGFIQGTDGFREHYRQYGMDACVYACEDRRNEIIANMPITNIQTCPNGGQVDLNNPPGTTLQAACHIDPIIAHRGSCVHDLLGASPGAGSVCGSQQTIDVYVGLMGWHQVPGTNCANSPRTHWAWQQCGGYD